MIKYNASCKHELNVQFPSPLIEIGLPGEENKRRILIPRNEVFRFRNIFIEHEYGIPPCFIPKGPATIVDIGANIGLFALYMKKIKPQSTILCFEPVPDTFVLLKHNIAAYNDFHIYPIALSNRTTSAPMALHPANSGENSLKLTNCDTLDNASIQVQVVDAGAMFSQIGLTYIDFLKIDTEGCEVEILESLKSYLPYVGMLMIEYHSESDRRKIDKLLPDHLLLKATIKNLHIGTVQYLNARLSGDAA